MADQAALARGHGATFHSELESVETTATPALSALASGADPIPSAAAVLTGCCPAIERVKQLACQVAAFDTNVLVLGESGTGKEVVARAIHETSPRRRRSFVPINCGAIPSELLESELFGHEKGAFTGALAARKGRFEMAEGGTIFLDEIGDMNPAMQVKLLRVLQERVFERVGSCASQRCNVRVIAATHRNLEEAIARGTFREDLYYRLNVVPIEMPPLRERIEDLPLLIAALVERLAGAGQPRVRFTSAALAALCAYRWPGNVRELGNLIERMAVQCGGRAVAVADLPPRYRPASWEESVEPASKMIESIPATSLLAPGFEAGAGAVTANAASAGVDAEADASAAAPGLDDTTATLEPAPPGEGDPPPMDAALTDALLAELPRDFDLREYLEALERRLIARALQSAGGTVAQAARLLGLRRTTLVEKLRKYALSGGEDSTAES
jgi:sigma-54 dependent transcriptional regulator, flagellar regulatory protein